MSYPNLLAGGVTSQDQPIPTDLFAGEAPVVTDRAQAGAVDLEQFRVFAFDESGLMVPWNPDAGAAQGVLTFSGVGTADDTITINGHVITLKASGAVGPQINIGASATLTAQNLKAYVNAHPDETGVKASGAAAAITLTAIEPGVVGNSITTTEAGTNTAFGAATLVGGSEEAESEPAGILAQPVKAGKWGPYYRGGVFNHAALVWPAGVTTFAQRKHVFPPLGALSVATLF